MISRPRILFFWEKFAPYHMDRCEACAIHFRDRYEVRGIEIASHSDFYQWDPTGPGENFIKSTLFPGASNSQLSQCRYFISLLRACVSSRAEYIFLCGFQFPPIFLVALCLRSLGRRIIIMQDSKFDDKPRRLVKECLKALLYMPYHAALVGSPRSAQYLEFLGFLSSRIFLGYDVASMDRVVRLAACEPAPGGATHAQRHITIIARFVPEKNLSVALAAYAVYRRQHRGTRDLHLCGSGPLEDALKDQVARLGIEGVQFRGYLQEEGIAKTLALSLALILPSVEEPFGLVVNEALALGVPVIVSENCGARDLLVRSGVNGYVFEPDNVQGLARLMLLLDRDAKLWARLASNSRAFRGVADTEFFAASVDRIIDALSP